MTMSSTSSELTHLLSSRLRVMAMARIVMVVALLLSLAPVYRYASATDVLVSSSAAYLLLSALVLAVLSRRNIRARLLLDASLFVDAVWAAVVVYVTGATSSGFIFLMYLQLVAVTVLFSWRTGVKLAVLHTIGLLAIFYGQAVGFAQEVADPQVTFGFFRVQLDTSVADLAVYTRQVLRVQTVANIVTVWVITGATAFFSNVNERALRRSNSELAVLRELNTQLERSLDLGDVCEAIAQGTVRELGYRRAVVWMSSGGTELVPAGADGFDAEDLAALSSLRLTAASGPVATAVEARRPVLVPREEARPAVLADSFSIDSPLVVVPLQSEGRILGLLTVEVDQQLGRAPRVRGRELRILATLATEASLALDNARLHAELRDMSITDALTGVYNHRHFQQRLQEELDRSARLSTLDMPRPLSLLLLDVDHFKKINDRFGHPAGDDILRMLSRLMQRVLRSTDVICRYGGEEFAVILPETPADAAMLVAGRLRQAIEYSSFTAADGRHLGQVTASFGVATFASGVPSRSGLIREADEALYVAKRSGRNRVVHAAAAQAPPMSGQATRTPGEPSELSLRP